MRVIGVETFGGPENLRVFEKPEPHAGPGEVRLAVKAIAVSPTDTMTRAGLGRPVAGPPYVPGMDAAGIVDEVGEGSPFAVGDEVMAFMTPTGEHGGAYSEYVVGPWESMAPIPEGRSLVEASTLPMNGLTAVQTLEKLDLAPGSTVAVTGAAGTLGAYVVQLAKDAGLTVIADSSDADRAMVEELGADYVVERGDDVAERILAIAPDGVDAVIDAAVQMEQVTSAVKPGGAFASFRFWKGDGTDGVRFEVISVFDEYLSHDKLQSLRAAVERGILTLRVAGVMSYDQASEVHRLLEAGGARGRFVLTFE